MAAWQPQPGPLEQLCGLLSRYRDPHADHRALLAQLEESRRHPEFLQYLAFVLARGEAVPPGVRQAAGLLLKNALKAGGFQSLAPAAREMIQASLPPPGPAPLPRRRRLTGRTPSTAGGAARWPGARGGAGAQHGGHGGGLGGRLRRAGGVAGAGGPPARRPDRPARARLAGRPGRDPQGESGAAGGASPLLPRKVAAGGRLLLTWS